MLFLNLEIVIESDLFNFRVQLWSTKTSRKRPQENAQGL
jgi:hypothetical protein